MATWDGALSQSHISHRKNGDRHEGSESVVEDKVSYTNELLSQLLDQPL